MKWTLLTVAAFCITGCFANAELATAHDRTLDEDYDPWEIGTPVYFEFEDGWYEGKIVAFEPSTGEYTVLWSDGDAEYYENYDIIDLMVDNYSNMARDYDDANCDDAWPDDTDVWVFEDGQGWWGKITQCQAGVYTTTWENGDVGYYSEDPEFDSMVMAAQELSNNEDPGDNYDSETATHDFTKQTYDEGTIVLKAFEDGWYEGEVLSFQNDTYTVRWSDGIAIDYPEGDEMDQMVADAVNFFGKEDDAGSLRAPVRQTPSGEDKKSGGFVFAMTLLVAVVGAAAFWVVRSHRKKKLAAQQGNVEGGFQDNAPPSELNTEANHGETRVYI